MHFHEILRLTIVFLVNSCFADAPKSAPYLSRPDLNPTVMNVTKYEKQNTWDGNIFISPWGTNTIGPSLGPHIFEPDGTLVWSGYGNVASMVMNFKPFDYSNDSKVSFFMGNAINSGIGMGRYAIMDDNYQVEKTLGFTSPYLHDFHEFQMTGNSTAVFTTYQPVPYDFSSNVTEVTGEGWVYQNVIIEIDMTSDEILFQWNSLDHFPLSDSMVLTEIDSEGFFDNAPFDYMHMNSIQKDDQGNFLVSSRHLWSIFYINGTDGSVIWTISSGVAASHWDIDEDAKFAFQHHARFVSAESVGMSSQNNTRYITVFDNEASEFSSIQTFQDTSRGMLLKLEHYHASPNSSIGRVSLVQELLPPDDYDPSGSQGSVQILPNGNYFVGWGSVPAITEYHRNGTMVFEAFFSDNSYRAFKSKWAGSPVELPALVSKGYRTNGSTVMAFSWNGATEVCSYSIYGGNASESLIKLDNINKTGFEDTYMAETPYQYFKIEALAINGSTLGNNTIKASQHSLSDKRVSSSTASGQQTSLSSSGSSSNKAPAVSIGSFWIISSMMFAAL